MKNTRYLQAVALSALLVIQPVLIRAADPINDEITALLTSGQWLFQGKNWSNVRTFKTDGTFHGRKDGNWKIENGRIRLIFVDHEDDLILPLDPKGTQGVDTNGLPLTAVQQDLPGAQPAAPAPPTSPAMQGSSAVQTEADINALFTSGQWHFQGKGWANDRVFQPDKTFQGGGSGTWELRGNVLVVITNSKEMKLTLPLNPKGTSGIGSTGFPVFIYRIGETPLPTPPRGSNPDIAANPTPKPAAPVRTPKPQIVRATPAPASTPMAPFGTSNPGTAIVPKDGTPAYYGTKKPEDAPGQ